MQVSSNNRYIFANYKMNLNSKSCPRLILNTISEIQACGDAKVEKNHEVTKTISREVIYGIFPPNVYLQQSIRSANHSFKNLYFGGQDVSSREEGNYTGEISAKMLIEIGCKFVIVGHSEVRSNQHQTSKDVQVKMTKASQAGLIPVVCLGESLEIRSQGQENDFIRKQLQESINNEVTNFIVAYEPIFAIGSGQAATSEQIANMHAFIKKTLNEILSNDQHDIPILYGGSVSASNAKSILSIEHVSGVLVGKASLDANSFLKIALSV